MKIGEILKEIPGTTFTIVAVGAIAYTIVAMSTTAIQNNVFHNIGGTVQVRGIELYYKGVEPYNPLIPLPWDDRNGHAEVRLKDHKYAFMRYENVTTLHLDGKIMVTDSKGNEKTFNKNSKYDRNTFEEIDELKGVLESVNLGRSISDIVEKEIQEAIANR